MFIAFPLNDKPDWRHPPWMTLLLIVANLVIFFGPQAWDNKRLAQATTFYQTSRLPELELPRYVQYRQQQTDETSRMLADELQQALARNDLGPLYTLMLADRRFLEKLHRGEIIRPDEPEYAQWREQHLHYTSLRGTPFTTRWASNPSDWDPVTAITSVFLHGSVAHLLGNMVFLFMFGYTVEKTLGKGRYLVFYLLAGIGGALGDLIARWGSLGIGLGASGAISGLMAMYVMLYGRRRIRFFYQLFFYFDYVRAPAILLLPAWISHEFLQQWLGKGGVAYMAHAGGLITGTLLITWHKYRHPETRVIEHTPPTDPVEDGLAAVRECLKTMNTERALIILVELTRTPAGRQNPRVLEQYFNLTRFKPASPDFHRAARLIFALKAPDATQGELIHNSFQTYLKQAKPSVQFTPDQLARLALRFSRDGHAHDAGLLARLLNQRAPEHPEMASVLLGAASSLHRQQAASTSPKTELHALIKVLQTRFPASAEARLAQQLLEPRSH